ARGIYAASQAQALSVVSDETTATIVFAEHVTQAARIDKVLRDRAVMCARNPVSESVVLVRPHSVRGAYANQSSFYIVCVRGVCSGTQIAIQIVAIAICPNRGVLIQIVGGVVGRHAVIRNSDSVTFRVILVSDRPAAGKDHSRDPANAVIAI